MRLLLPTVLVALLAVLSACGDDEPTTEPLPLQPLEAGEVRLVGGDDLQWDTPDVEVASVDGTVTIEVVCDGRIAHNVVLAGIDDEAVQAQCAGRTTGTGTVELAPGTYAHYCSIPGHRSAGMEGQLVVTG